MYECVDQFGRVTSRRDDYDGAVRHFVRNTAVQHLVVGDTGEILLERSLPLAGRQYGRVRVAMPSEIPDMRGMDVGIEFVNYEPEPIMDADWNIIGYVEL